MSIPEPGDSEETSPEPTEPVEASRSGWSMTALVAHDRTEPPASFTDRDALAAWAAVSALWHPALLTIARELPTIEDVGFPSSPEREEIRVIAAGQRERLPSGYRVQGEDAGSILIEGASDRAEIVREILSRCHVKASAPGDEIASLALDFQALGTACWWLRDLTLGMGHADGLDHTSLAREVFAGATAWSTGDANTTRNRLRAAFEILTQARERFYPVDAYLVDICLLDRAMPAGVLADALASRSPVTFLAQADAIETQAKVNPEALARLREAISEGWADVVGGCYQEGLDPLLPLASILWQFRKGGQIYREHLDSRAVESYARRRFGLYPTVPQIAKGFGFRFAVHLGFDAGKFPIRPEAKRLWESPDHSTVETLTRPPLAGDRALEGLRLPWRLASSMKDDHVATLAIVHWPSPVAGWWLDLRRIASYSPVLARCVTLNDYFHLTDRPFETFAPEPDRYITPYLAQAVARKEATPVSSHAEHARLRARYDGVRTARAIAQALGSTEDAVWSDPEDLVETDRCDEAREAIQGLESVWAGALASGVAGNSAGGRPGYLVINPCGVSRRAAVLLPEASADLRPEGPLRASQFTEEGVWGVVDLPAYGFGWVPRETNSDASSATNRELSVRDRVLKNESVSVAFDASTGGLRAIMSAVDETPRLGQQLVISGLKTLDGQPASSSMRATAFEVEYGGPALIQAVSQGELLGPNDRRLARFRQRVRIWAGRPTIELQVEFEDIDPSWLATIADADPWTHHLALRWAWPDSSTMLRRLCLLSPEMTEANRPETPDALDLSTRRQRTALLFGGLPYHQRHGSRMLDTILIAGSESCRSFTLGVVLDLEHPFHASTELIAPAYVVPVETGPPRIGPTGWLFQVNPQGIAVISVEAIEAGEDGQGWGLAFHLRETTGRPARGRLRTFRNPSWAKQTDFQGGVIVDLPVEGDTVMVDLTPHEVARVEVTLG
jgi:alpha-mannosidase